MDYFLLALRKYATFKGRTRRNEYWIFVAFNILFGLIALLVDNVFEISFKDVDFGYGPIYLAYNVAMVIPSVSIAVRRLHDVGKSGWFLLIALIPVIGYIWLLVLFVSDSQPGTNKYGINPKDENYKDEDADESFYE